VHQRLACGWLTLGVAAALGAGVAAEARRDALDPTADTRLAQRIDVAARRTTVARLLARLQSVTGVGLAATDDRVAQEPLVMGARDESLGEVLRLIAAAFATPGVEGAGWFWIRRGNGSGATYALAEDLVVRRRRDALLQEGRRAFLLELQDRRREESTRGAGAIRVPLLAALPWEAVVAAVQGRPQVIPWNQMSPELRRAGSTMVGVEAGQDTRCEVVASGSGRSQVLRVGFMTAGQGGSTVAYAPRRQSAAASPPTSHVFRMKSREYPGVLALKTALPPSRAASWESADYGTALLELAVASSVSLVSDDYAYLLGWPPKRPLPGGEPLGLWVDRLLAGSRSALTQLQTLQVREDGGALLFRNEGAVGDDLERPSAATRAWLNRLRFQTTGHLLGLGEVRRLLREVDDAGLLYLSLTMGPPDLYRLRGFRGCLRLEGILTPAQRARLNGTGLRFADLSPEQQAEATRETREVKPAVSKWALRNTLPDPTFALQVRDGAIRWTRWSARQPPLTTTAPLRLGADDEVCWATKVK
jgi:hypothetical protein